MQSHAVVHSGGAFAGGGGLAPPHATSTNVSNAARDIFGEYRGSVGGARGLPSRMRWTWLIGPALLGACYGDPDRFNEKQAEVLCRIEDKCGVDVGVGDTPGSSCVDGRVDELSTCASFCEYDEDAARSCIRGIKHALRGRGLLGPNCEYANGTLEDCARVYTSCEQPLEEDLHCEVSPPDVTCSIGSDARFPWALALLCIAVRRRRVSARAG